MCSLHAVHLYVLVHKICVNVHSKTCKFALLGRNAYTHNVILESHGHGHGHGHDHGHGHGQDTFISATMENTNIGI